LITNNAHQSFTDLDVWKSARKLKIRIWNLVKNFPPEEKYRLCDQLIRSSRGVTSMIAEGHGKFTYKDKINYCIMGRGSLSETWNHLIDAIDSEYISKEELKSFKIDMDETAKLLNGYINFLRTLAEKEKNK
jgi:four helix bundle protein